MNLSSQPVPGKSLQVSNLRVRVVSNPALSASLRPLRGLRLTSQPPYLAKSTKPRCGSVLTSFTRI